MPRPSLALPVIAIFFAIGGIGYAASTIGTGDIKDGAVTTKKLHKHAVTRGKLHKNAVTSPKVKNHSLRCVDLRHNCLRGPAGATGPRGATGPAGASGPGSIASFDNLITAPSGTTSVTFGDFTVTETATNAATPQCGTLKLATGGVAAHYETDFFGTLGLTLAAHDTSSSFFATGGTELTAVSDNGASSIQGAVSCTNVGNGALTAGFLTGH